MNETLCLPDVCPLVANAHRERDEARAEVERLREAIEHFIAALDDGTQISAAVALLELRAALEVER